MNYELLSETEVFSTPYFSILDRHYRLPDGSEQHYFVRQEVDTCCVLARTKEGQFIVVKEFRVGPQEMFRELPAGRLESFDDDADHRIEEELLEETGYQGELKKIGVLPTSPYSTRMIHCYYAVNCEKVAEPSLGPGEYLTVELVNQEEMRELLMSGKSSSCSPGLLAWEWMKQDGLIS